MARGGESRIFSNRVYRYSEPVCLILSLGSLAQAAPFNWNALNGGNWSLTTAAGWDTGGGADYPKSADDVANVNKNINPDKTITIDVADAKTGTLFLSDNQGSPTSHWNIGGANPLTFEVTSGDALLNIGRSSGASVFSAPIILNSDLEIRTQATSEGVEISSEISDGSGSHGLIKTQDNLLTLSGVNIFTGKTAVTGGTVRVFADSGLGTAPVSPVADSITLNGGTLDTQGPGNFAIDPNRGMTLGAGGGTWSTTTPSGSHIATYNGVITGPGSLTKAAGQTLILGGLNAYAGNTLITGGVLRIFADRALGTAPVSPVADSITLDGGTLETRGPTSFTIDSNRGITLGAGGGTWMTTTPSGSHTATYDGVITAVGSLTKTFGAVLRLGGDNDFSGGLVVTSGNLYLSGNNAITGGQHHRREFENRKHRSLECGSAQRRGHHGGQLDPNREQHHDRRFERNGWHGEKRRCHRRDTHH